MPSVYFDILCGASGDMILSSLIDAGVPVDYLMGQLAQLKIEGLCLTAKKVKRNGIECTGIDITWSEQKAYRHLPQILDLIKTGDYPQHVVANAEKILLRIGQAEAEVHGIPLEKVHFHEIGAVDTIVDILGACLALDYLNADKVFFSRLTIGRGTVKCDHGIMPVPVPATAQMLKGFESVGLDIHTEILTPTGCAILTALGEQVSSMPGGNLTTVGYGCGTKEFDGYPNALRVLVFDASGAKNFAADTVAVLETDIDHISGEILAFTAQRVMESGALDVSWSPVFMKKGRPGYRLTVLCKPSDQTKLIDTIVVNTRTLGVRYHLCERTIALRESGADELDGAAVATKGCTYKGVSFTKAEYESLATIAREKGIPLIDVVESFSKK